MGFYLCQNNKFSFPKNVLSGFCRSTGPVDRARSRSTDSVDRRAQTCTSVWLEGRSTGTVDRPESSALWKGPGRPGGRPGGEPALCIQAMVDRPVDRGSNGQKSDRWRSTGPVDRGSNGQKSDHWRSIGPVDRQSSGLKNYPNG